jgi:hypothetical protein
VQNCSSDTFKQGEFGPLRFVIGQDKVLFKRELYFDAQFHKLLVTRTFLQSLGFCKYARLQ